MFLVHVNKFLHAMLLSERKKSLFYFSQVDFSRVSIHKTCFWCAAFKQSKIKFQKIFHSRLQTVYIR